MSDQGLQSERAEQDAHRRAHLDEPAVDVEARVAQREPRKQCQHRVTAEREWQAFMHESSLCHAPCREGR